jgi:Zn-dependent M28 family amino/carboxypeptidase
MSLGNVIARRGGRRGDLIVVMSHHDTARLPGTLPLGANDGASGPALLIELALQLRPIVTRSEIWLVSCDASHPLRAGEPRDRGYHGSRELLRILAKENKLGSIRAVVVADRVADRSLHLTPDGRGDEGLQDAMLGLADGLGIALLADPRPRLTRELDVLKREADPRFRIPGDHVPFFEAGIGPLVAIVDGERDGVVLRTAVDRDGLSEVSVESLRLSGNLVFELVRTIDARQ